MKEETFNGLLVGLLNAASEGDLNKIFDGAWKHAIAILEEGNGEH